MSGMVGMLTRPLDCVGSDRELYILPAGHVVTVRAAGSRSLVVLDGRVYRAVSSAVRVSER